MSSIGTGYDLSTSVFSPDGRIFQIDYGQKVSPTQKLRNICCLTGWKFLEVHKNNQLRLKVKKSPSKDRFILCDYNARVGSLKNSYWCHINVTAMYFLETRSKNSQFQSRWKIKDQWKLYHCSGFPWNWKQKNWHFNIAW